MSSPTTPKIAPSTTPSPAAASLVVGAAAPDAAAELDEHQHAEEQAGDEHRRHLDEGHARHRAQAHRPDFHLTEMMSAVV